MDRLPRSGWLGWLVVPYIIMGALRLACRSQPARTALLVIATVAGVAGTAAIVGLLHNATDGLVGLAVMAVPAVQSGLLIVVGVPLLLALNRKTAA